MVYGGDAGGDVERGVVWERCFFFWRERCAVGKWGGGFFGGGYVDPCEADGVGRLV